MPSVAGGAGSSFDWAVEFGNGAGPMGNFQLQTASFTLSLFGDLFVSNLLESSFASGGSLAVQMAAHIQGISALTGATSETIGGTIVPEPSTAMLMAFRCSPGEDALRIVETSGRSQQPLALNPELLDIAKCAQLLDKTGSANSECQESSFSAVDDLIHKAKSDIPICLN